MNYIRCGMAQAKLTRIALRLRRESAINNNNVISSIEGLQFYIDLVIITCLIYVLIGFH